MTTTIDEATRAKAAVALRRFRDGELSGWAFEEAWPTSGDVAIGQIGNALWYLYDDLIDHYYRPNTDAAALIDQCLLFLESRHTYDWPRPNPWLQLLAIPLAVVTFGLSTRILWARYRFPDYWPFATQIDLGRAIETQRNPASQPSNST